MAQKNHPVSLRLNKTNKLWSSCWYGDHNYTEQCVQDYKVHAYIENICRQTKMAPPITFIKRAHQEMRTLLFFPRGLLRPGQQRTPRVGLRTKKSGSFLSITRPLQPSSLPVPPLFSFFPCAEQPPQGKQGLGVYKPAHASKAMQVHDKKAQTQGKSLDIGLQKNTGVATNQEKSEKLLRNGATPAVPLEKVPGKEQMQFVGQKRGDWFCKSVFPRTLLFPSLNNANLVQGETGTIDEKKQENPPLPTRYSMVENQGVTIIGFSFLSHLLLSLFLQKKKVSYFVHKNFPQLSSSKTFCLETNCLQHHQSTWRDAASMFETLSRKEKNKKRAPLKNHLESFLFQQGKQRCKVDYLVCLSAQQNPFFLATQIVFSLEERVPFRRLKHRLMRECGKDHRIKGVRICCSGRVATRSKKAQKARTESIQWGQTSLNVFSDFVHFASKSALTPFGKIGVKVWICYK